MVTSAFQADAFQANAFQIVAVEQGQASGRRGGPGRPLPQPTRRTIDDDDQEVIAALLAAWPAVNQREH